MRALVLLAVLSGFGCKSTQAIPPNCLDQVRNGDESDVDCGGAVCPGCVPGRLCQRAEDCLSRVCGSDGRCVAERCDDQVRNGSESDIDCGGPNCHPCAAGMKCAGYNDCQSQICADGGCVMASCRDGVKNGDEMGLDCGGSCPPCDASPGRD